MVHREVLERFKHLFPQYEGYIKTWFPNGKDSVRLRQLNGQEFVFTFHSDKDWCFETLDSHLKHMKGGK